MSAPIHGLVDALRQATPAGGRYGIPVGMIRWRVGQLHVGTSALTIAREFWHRRAAKFPRPIKRAVVRAAIKAHKGNRELYAAVMEGRV